MAEQNLDELILQLKDKDDQVRKKAAQALGKLGPEASSAVYEIIQALKDENVNVRFYATQALCKIGVRSKQVIEALNQTLSDQNQYVRLIAAAGSYYLDPENKVSYEILLQFQKEARVRHQSTIEASIKGQKNNRKEDEDVPERSA
jgi:HEAT repeat protein